MVSTSARNAGGPWFDSRSRHDRLLYANSVCLYIYIYIFIYITYSSYMKFLRGCAYIYYVFDDF